MLCCQACEKKEKLSDALQMLVFQNDQICARSFFTSTNYTFRYEPAKAVVYLLLVR